MGPYIGLDSRVGQFSSSSPAARLPLYEKVRSERVALYSSAADARSAIGGHFGLCYIERMNESARIKAYLEAAFVRHTHDYQIALVSRRLAKWWLEFVRNILVVAGCTIWLIGPTAPL